MMTNCVSFFKPLRLAIFVASALMAYTVAHAADAFPKKPITIIVSLQVGSASDIASRVVADKMSEKFHVPVVVENQPGAGGVLGALKLNSAKPHGYTIAALNNGLITLVPNLPQRPPMEIGALTPISLISVLPSVLVVSKDVPAHTLGEFVAYSKKNAGEISYGSVGMGSPQHIAMEMLKLATGADLLHVPYRGGPQAVSDVVSGQIQATWIAVSVAMPFIKTGQLRPLAVGGSERSSELPDVPTLKEAGVDQFEYIPWVAFYAPPNTPKSIVRELSEAVQHILKQPAVKQKIASYGLQAMGSTSEELMAKGTKERTLMAKVIKKDLKIN